MLNYNEFTKRRPITKAIRFELVPYGDTSKHLLEDGIIDSDIAMTKKKEALRPVIDAYIRHVASKALTSVEYDFASLREASVLTGKDRKEVYEKQLDELKTLISSAVDEALPDGLTVSKLNSKTFFDALREYVLNAKEVSFDRAAAAADIEATKGYLLLFTKFLDSRKTALTTWMMDRIIENFEIYCRNIGRINAVLDAGIAPDYEDELTEMRSADYYNEVLSQSGIDGYNRVLSGVISEKGIVEKGINILINEHNTRIRSEKLDLPFLRQIDPLRKQILEPTEKQFQIEAITSDHEVSLTIDKAQQAFRDASGEIEKLLNTSDGTGVYVKGNNIHQLSFLLLDDHNALSNTLKDQFRAELMEEKNTSDRRRAKEIDKILDGIGSYISKKDYEISELAKNQIWGKTSPWDRYRTVVASRQKLVGLRYNELVSAGIMGHAKIKGSPSAHEKVVAYFDSLKDLRDALYVLRAPSNAPCDPAFYNSFDAIRDQLSVTHKAENLVRNFITKKVSDDARMTQTCLGSPSRFESNWSNGEGKFSKKNASIIKHNGEYFYFVLSPTSKPAEISENLSGDAEFLIMKKMSKLDNNLPKFFFTYGVEPYFKEHPNAKEAVLTDRVRRPVTVPKEVYDIKKSGLYTKDSLKKGLITEEEFRHNVATMINAYKAFIAEFVQFERYDLSGLSSTEEFEDIGEFYKELETYTAKIDWLRISFSFIEELVSSGTAYLFTITDRFLKKGEAQKNAYSRLLVQMLSKENSEHMEILLNSNPGVYFRAAALPKKTTHKIGSILVNNRTAEGDTVPTDIRNIVYRLKNGIEISEDEFRRAKKYMADHTITTRKATMELSYRQNYMSDKYFLSLTYRKNSDVSERAFDRINDRVNEATKDHCNVLAAVRSTTDLVYVMVTNETGTVLEEKSLNVINGTDYRILLGGAQKEKQEAKKIWDYGVSAADQKEAYIDLAITEIIHMARKYNALIVVESIDERTKDRFSFLDTAIFKTFENRIAERLSDVVFRDVPACEPGSTNNPLQLANNSGNTYQDGILNYVNPAYTRDVDPDTGFVNVFARDRINSIGSKRQFFANMDEITFDGKNFSFRFNYDQFPTRINATRSEWTVKVGGSTVILDREKKSYRFIQDVAADVLIPLSGGADLSGNIADKIMGREIPSPFVEELWKQFLASMYGFRRQTSKCDAAYVSPITHMEYVPGHVSALNLIRKYFFRREFSGDKGDFTAAWIDYLQSA